jgi:Bacterial dnaA protein helix-turn-helix
MTTIKRGPERTWPLMREIVDATAQCSKIPGDVLMGRRKSARIVTARHASMLLTYHITGRNFSWLGKQFGKHHTSVTNCIRNKANCPAVTKMATSVLAVLRDKYPLVDSRIEKVKTDRNQYLV